MTRRMMIGVAGFALLAAVAPSCGDKLSIGSFARIEVTVDGNIVEDGGAVGIPQALQLPVPKRVEIINPGNKTLTITGIDWAVDPDSGAKLKNKYVEIDWQGIGSGDLFPRLLADSGADTFGLVVKYTPPLGYALDDFSDSVLVISSDARSADGKRSVKEVRVTFEMTTDTAAPKVTPANSYTFVNATKAQPERQTFRIYNDPQIATAPFIIEDIRLQTASNEFRLLDLPSANTQVLEPNNAGYADVTFTVEYAPVDETPDTNVLLIETDAGDLSVQLKTDSQSGSYSLSYDHPSAFDFTHVTSVESRSLQIVSAGPSALTVEEPEITPEEALEDFDLKVYKPATSAAGEETEVTSWPQGLAVGRSLRFEITYSPRADGADTSNGKLEIPYRAPDFDTIVVDLFSGEPKSKIALAPSTNNVYVCGDVTAGDTGSRNVVIYNEGNGPLELVSASIAGKFAGSDPQVWELHSEFSSTSVPVGGLLVLPLDFDLSGLPDTASTAADVLTLEYHDDFTDQVEPKTITLLAAHDNGLPHPVADVGTAADYAGAVVDEVLTVSGAGSTGAATTGRPYIWYLTGKPAGSFVMLNEEGDSSAEFVPDLAGDYTVELVVFAQSGDTLLYSDPASVTITVSE